MLQYDAWQDVSPSTLATAWSLRSTIKQGESDACCPIVYITAGHLFALPFRRNFLIDIAPITLVLQVQGFLGAVVNTNEGGHLYTQEITGQYSIIQVPKTTGACYRDEEFFLTFFVGEVNAP